MKYLKEFMIIILFSFLGECLHQILPLPVPASIYGILLLFLALLMKWIRLDQVKTTAHFLIEIMPVLFIPAAAGLINSWDVLKNKWLYYILVIVISTVAVMGITGKVTDFVLDREKRQ